MNINLIYKNDDYLVVEKPVGVPVQPDKTGDLDLLTSLEEQFGKVWLLHRLDRPVGGVMVFARNEKCASYISSQINNNTLQKSYYAVCCGVPENKNGELRDYLVKNQRLNISTVSDKKNKNSKEAILEYEVVDCIEDNKYGVLSLIDVKLHTGRHHQIRVQLSNAGFPIWGDVKYNPEFKRGYFNISPSLYSYSIGFIPQNIKHIEYYKCLPKFEPFSNFSKIKK